MISNYQDYLEEFREGESYIGLPRRSVKRRIKLLEAGVEVERAGRRSEQVQLTPGRVVIPVDDVRVRRAQRCAHLLFEHVVHSAAQRVEVGRVGNGAGRVPDRERLGAQVVVVVVEQIDLACDAELLPEAGNAGPGQAQPVPVYIVQSEPCGGGAELVAVVEVGGPDGAEHVLVVAGERDLQGGPGGSV